MATPEGPPPNTYTRVFAGDAVVSMVLDGTGTTKTVYAHPKVDVDDIVRVGRNGRFVGVSYATDRREAVITDAGRDADTLAEKRKLQHTAEHPCVEWLAPVGIDRIADAEHAADVQDLQDVAGLDLLGNVA